MTITVDIMADSVSESSGKRLTTYQLRYPRFIHAEVMTHRVFARNASSSRAIPVTKMMKALRQDPAMPERWGKNGKGMQDHGPLEQEQEEIAKALWLRGRDSAIDIVGKMMIQKEQPHKQIVNRILEPWMHIDVIMTGTEWANFFALRCHEDADPTFQVLAKKMHAAMEESTPKELAHGKWHLPYIRVEDRGAVIGFLEESNQKLTEQNITHILIKLSVARCARVSYTTHHGDTPSIAEDIALHDRLLLSQPVHASPGEHQATPDKAKFLKAFAWENPQLHGPLVGWCQYRKTIPGENILDYQPNEAA